MSEEVSLFRLYLMRLLYLLNFVALGISVWPGLIILDKSLRDRRKHLADDFAVLLPERRGITPYA
jgi:hypothetical protein